MRLIDADKLPLDIEHEDIDDAPTIDAVEVVHGEWERPSRPKTYERICSGCGGKAYFCGQGDYKFCPNCGANMDGKRIEK